ncbi:hypothetical protein MNBD_UNCLBAC01-659 [hydrothermal vent metagenome]|uniref:Uncharacterized protein n=1 Tax=hydrothermal vent metagenome TaxID=652676 RepID=A0A3B1D0E1_9ZZZZ
MRRFTSILTIILFLIWIFPLGAFIAPENEKKTCNGKRAICLCSHLIAKKMAKMEGKVFLKSVTANTEQSQSSVNSDFLVPMNNFLINKIMSQYLQQPALVYDDFISKAIDHVPKA